MKGLALLLVAAAPAAADPGRDAWEARCGGCHSLEADRVGPRHAGVVGRRAGSVPGFPYSPALKGAGFAWTPALLDRWLQGPRALVPGTAMAVSVGDPAARAAIVDFLVRQPAPR